MELIAAFAEKEKILATEFAAKDAAMQKELERKEQELTTTRTRADKKIDAATKEVTLLKDLLSKKDQEAKETLERAIHDEEIKEKMLESQNAKLKAMYGEKMAALEQKCADLEAKLISEINRAKDEITIAKNQELAALKLAMDKCIADAEAEKRAAIDEAVKVILEDKMAVIAEKERLEMEVASKEEAMAAILEKELTADQHIENQAKKAMKDAAIKERKYESDLKGAKHELDVANQAKERLRSECQADKEKAKVARQAELESAKKEYDMKIKEERRRCVEIKEEYEEKLKKKEKELSKAGAEIAKL